LVGAGALISNFILPKITSKWQNHQKELELKVSLVNRINESVINILMDILYSKKTTKTAQEKEKSYREWEISKDLIQSQLYAYFPSQKISCDWNEYGKIIEDFFILASADRSKSETINTHVNNLKKSLNFENIDLGKLEIVAEQIRIKKGTITGNFKIQDGGFLTFSSLSLIW
jgi:hypothetical protein